MTPFEHDELLRNFCMLVLIDDDSYSSSDKQQLTEYVSNLKDEDLVELNKFDQNIAQEILEASIDVYIARHYESDGLNEPFCFDSGDNYIQYREFFKECFIKKHNIEPPKVFALLFDCIRQKSSEYRQFAKFYKVQLSFLQNTWIDIVQEKAKDSTINLANDAVKQAQEAKNQAEVAAQKAAESAFQKTQVYVTKAATEAKNAADQASVAATQITNKVINERVGALESKLSHKASETSVTILGIFAGIVLTVVAGLFYSSSVLDNIKGTDLNKLIIVASLVGLVCINVIAVMFNYIDKFRTSKIPLEAIDNRSDNEANKSCESPNNKSYEEPQKESLESPKETTAAKSKRSKIKKFAIELHKKICEHFFVAVIDIFLVMTMLIAGIVYNNSSHSDIVADDTSKNNNTNVSVDVNTNNNIPSVDSGSTESVLATETSELPETESNEAYGTDETN